ncbi:AraC family transcriptional regulator [Cohnella endophytica]|uniref:AraC family transcriptional regulator n=1 Tax=Cohnella endophytica TaxID=2419778 RepID=A0A494YAP2_9BACL|nr:AraC family transcriptional regulator [Cohnella endophytica]RKP57348.1 AraC family transcriptional regulator [Cohnella endophytica]
MNPIRKPFRLDPIFPFDIVFKDRKNSRTELPDHLHDLYELVYVYEGKGTFFIDNAFYEKEEGDLFLIPGNTIHRSFPDADRPILSTAVFFAPAFVESSSLDDAYVPLRCFDIARKKKQYKIELTEEFKQRTRETLDEIADELRNKEPGYRHAVRLGLQRLLLTLGRLPFTREDGSMDKRIGPQWIMDALRSIDNDPGQSGGLAELAAKACVSASHFSRVFKQLTGMNVTDYVNAKRLVLAKELLLSTDDNVESIALACGFQGLPHFYLTFKKLTGMTPRAYRLIER